MKKHVALFLMVSGAREIQRSNPLYGNLPAPFLYMYTIKLCHNKPHVGHSYISVMVTVIVIECAGRLWNP